MGFMGNWKGRQAMLAHNNGDKEKAGALYEEAIAKGCNAPNVLMAYAVLLLRGGSYEKARDILRKAEKAPGLTPQQRTQLITHYAVVAWKLGNLDRALELLYELFHKAPNSLLYNTLGYLLIEKGDFDEALAFCTQAVDYDDEDPVSLDNMGQVYYRLGNSPDKARPYFDKALAIKDTQIDTLYFLAQYDIAEGKPQEAREKLEKALLGNFSPLNYATRERLQAQIDSL